MVVGADLLPCDLRLTLRTLSKRPNLWQHARLTATLLPQSDASGQASISSRASAEAKGTALSRSKADLVTIFLGTNDFSAWCMKPPEALPCDAGAKLATVLDEFRAVQPRVPIAVITPLTRRDEGHATCCVTLEGARQQLKAEVVKRQVRGDRNLVVVDGPPLLPAAALDGDGLHPKDDAAARDLALVPAHGDVHEA